MAENLFIDVETYSSVDIGILTAFHQLQGGMK